MTRPKPLCLIAIFLFLIFTGTARAVVVSTVAELVAAVNNANQGGDKYIECENGTYELNDLLHIIADSITVKSLHGIRDSVIVRGQGMGGDVSHVFLVQGADFSVRDLTLGWVANHGVQIQGEQNADRPRVQNIRFVDTYEQMLKVSAGGVEFSDSGLVEQCLFEYSAGVGPQYYIGGIDCHRSRNWIVRNNIFKYIRSPGGSMAEHAIHFWNNSANTLVECNLIITCDRGIGFGLGSSPHTGGIIRNNMIYHDTTEGFADVGIALETCPDAQVYNNTIYHEHNYQNAIEYRFPATTNVFIANNLTNKDIRARDGATGTDTSNIKTAVSGWFVDVATGDLHLDYEVPTVVDQGIPVIGLTQDYDGDPRPQGSGFDIGADEFVDTGIMDAPLHSETSGSHILQVYPNPFRKKTNVRFMMQDTRFKIQDFSLQICDVSGQLIKNLLVPSAYCLVPTAISWDGTDHANRMVAPGVYFLRLGTRHKSITKKIIKLK